MHEVDRPAEAAFADWIRRREAGRGEPFEDLLQEHSDDAGELADLHAAWLLLSRALGGPPASPSEVFSARADGDRYRRVRLLGRGGQGEVWLAEDRRLGRRVALKLVAAGSPQRVKRFEREAAVTSRLDHPGICPVYESGAEGDVLFIAMRYVEGESLAERLRTSASARARPGVSGGSSHSSGPSAQAEIRSLVRIVAGAARALHAAHEAGVIHRDVKPANILITREGLPVIVDFGLAEDTEGGWTELTGSREFLGTPAYMSPEQLQGRGNAAVDRRTDVWSLGVTLYECLTGERPFLGPTSQATFRAITGDEPTRAKQRNRALPLDLDVVVSTALEKDRERRYASAAALAADLEAWLGDRPIAARPVSSLGKLLRWGKREPALALAAGSLALALPLLGALATHAVLTREDVRAGGSARIERRVETRLEEGFAHFARWDLAPAVAAFDEVLAIRPGCLEAAVARMLALRQQGHEAAALFAQLPQLPAGGFLERFCRELLEQSFLPADALEWLQGLPEPQTEAEHFLAGWMLLVDSPLAVSGAARRGGFQALPRLDPQLDERARDHLQSALLQSSSPRLLYLSMYARALNRTGASPQLLWSLHEAIAVRWPEAMEARGSAAEAMVFRDAARARAAFEGILEECGEDSRLYNGLGTALGVLGERARADASFLRAIELDPSNATAHYNLGVGLIAMDRFEQARERNRAAVSIDPTHAEAWSNVSLTALHMGAFDEAIDAARECLRLTPGQAYALAQLARALLRKGDLDAAWRTALETRESTRARAGWRVDGEALVADIEELRRQAERLDAWLEHGALDPSPAEQAELAWCSVRIGRHEEGAGLFGDLAAGAPQVFELADVRRRAASAAAWASTRDGEAAGEWRERALGWMQVELEAVRRAVGDGEPLAGELRERVRSWRRDPDLAPLREEHWLQGADAPTRARCAELWLAVEELLARPGDA